MKQASYGGFFATVPYRRTPLQKSRSRHFRLRNYRSKRTRETRRRLLWQKCFACSRARASILCETCAKFHCYRCCYRDFNVCSNCVLQRFEQLLGLHDAHQTLAINKQLSRRDRTRSLVHLAPFLSKCTVCFSTGLHKLCADCLGDTCDACLEPEQCVCANCLPSDLACYHSSLKHHFCFACRVKVADALCESCAKFHCRGCCFRDFDICGNCVLQHFSPLLRLQDPHRTLAIDTQLSRRERTRTLMHLAPSLSRCTCCQTTGIHLLCVACLRRSCDACLEPETSVCVSCLPTDNICFYCSNCAVCCACLLCNATCCPNCMATPDTCMLCQHISED